MKAILNRRTIIIFSTALLIAIIAIVSVNAFSSAGPVSSVANTVTRPVRALAATLARTFGSIFSSIYEYEELLARNEELNRRIAEMETDFRESAELAAENRQLRALLDFDERYGGYNREPAVILDRGGDNWSATFVIDKGYQNSDISRGMGVATEYGYLIGQVSEVGPMTSVVIYVYDTKFSASAYVGSTDIGLDASGLSDSTAVAKGDFSYMNSGMLILDDISEDMIVRKGDTVITTGFGGVFPPGLLIGEVQDVNKHTNNIGRIATVSPLDNIDTLTNVFIITGWESSNTTG